MRSAVLWAFKALLVMSAAGSVATMLGFNIYLLETRPVVSYQVPDKPPANWACGRIVARPYCVEITRKDRAISSTFGMLAILFGLPTFFAFVIARQLRPPDEYEEYL